jgi:hypothetical protein
VKEGSLNIEVPNEPKMQSITGGHFPLHEMGLGYSFTPKSKSVEILDSFVFEKRKKWVAI